MLMFSSEDVIGVSEDLEISRGFCWHQKTCNSIWCRKSYNYSGKVKTKAQYLSHLGRTETCFFLGKKKVLGVRANFFYSAAIRREARHSRKAPIRAAVPGG